MNTDPDTIAGIRLVPEPSRDQLTEKQHVDYRHHRRQFLEWMLTCGKRPSHDEGYAQDTVRVRAYRTDKFYRWVWTQAGRYTTAVTGDHADAYLREVATTDKSATHKANLQKALVTLFNWRTWAFGDDDWEPAITFSNSSGPTNPRDFFTVTERQRLREAALEVGSIPHYKSVSGAERRNWQRYLAQRFQKSMAELSRADWDRANGWKNTSLLHVSLDAGLRPSEVERATVAWVDPANQCLRIPKEEAAKSNEAWVVSLRAQTADVLANWLEERQQYEKYENTDALWLTREGNPYGPASLKHLLTRVCGEAGIDTTHRSISWYTIRHSVGTYMTREEGLAAAQAQLRHKSEVTTMKYDQAPVEDRRQALDRMG